MEKLELLKKALQLQEFELTDWKLETIILTYDKIKTVGDKFSLRDAIKIQKQIDDKLNKDNESSLDYPLIA